MKLTQTEIEDLKTVERGADIYSMALAIRYRDLEQKGLVTITKAKDPPKSVKKRRPYFGCITNEEGHRALRDLRGEKQSKITKVKLVFKP